MDHAPFDAHITIGHKEQYIKNVGSMDNAKRHAKRLADELGLKPKQRNWETISTQYAANSGMYGGWESEANRLYQSADGKEVLANILRA